MQAIRPTIMVVCVAAWVCLVIFVVVPLVTHRDSIYTGQEAFQSQVAYESFKSGFENAVHHSGAELDYYNDPTSEHNITVSYSVHVPYNYDFPYGVSTTHALDWLAILLLSLVWGAIVVLPAINIFFFKWSYRAYPMPKRKAKVK